MTVRRIALALCLAASLPLLAGCPLVTGNPKVIRREPTTRQAEASAVTRPTTTMDAGPTSRAARRVRSPMENRFVTRVGDGLTVGATLDHAAATQPTGVAIVSPKDDFPLVGTWTSPTIDADFPFTELIPSWNVTVPDETGARFEVRVKDAASGEWSPWLYIGYWGRITREKTTTEFARGQVDIDELVLTQPANAFEIRSTLYNYRLGDRAHSPTLRRVSAAYSRKATGPSTLPAVTSITPTTLPVPFRAQGVEDRAISGSICSPTSTSMVLAWAGTALPTAQNAMTIWDDDYALFGNWNRAVQFAGSLGYDAWLERFDNMDQVRARLREGQPVIASIRFRKGEFPSSVLQQTAGHLIVVRGFDANGDLICNDPASKDRGEAVVYKSDELARAWLLNAGGVGYVIRKKP